MGDDLACMGHRTADSLFSRAVSQLSRKRCALACVIILISEVVHNEHSLALGFEVTAGRSRKFKNCCAERMRFVHDNLLPCQLCDQSY